MSEDKSKTQLYGTISIAKYKPKATVINNALWGKDEPPGVEDVKKARQELAEMIARMHERQGR